GLVRRRRACRLGRAGRAGRAPMVPVHLIFALTYSRHFNRTHDAPVRECVVAVSATQPPYYVA
ncbi:MAG: hypothetical protein WB785_24710, partial [Mycobacterium sp.]